MIEKYARQLSIWLIQNGGDPAKKNIYAYGIECLANELISDLLLITCGILLNKTRYIIIWSVSFTIIRIFLGGYHASTHARCIFMGTSIGISSLYLNTIWISLYPHGFFITMILAMLVAFFYAPITHKNHPIPFVRRKQAKRNAVTAAVIESFSAIMLYPYDCDIASTIMTGLLTALIMALLPITISELKNDQKTYDV